MILKIAINDFCHPASAELRLIGIVVIAENPILFYPTFKG
jgi:hypothetical protein